MNTSSNYETEMEISQPEDSEGIMEFTTQNGEYTISFKIIFYK